MIGVIRYAVQEAGVTFFDTAEVYEPYVKWTTLKSCQTPAYRRINRNHYSRRYDIGCLLLAMVFPA